EVVLPPGADVARVVAGSEHLSEGERRDAVLLVEVERQVPRVVARGRDPGEPVRRLAPRDAVLLGVRVVALRGHGELHAAGRGVALPVADPPREPVGLREARPHVRGGRAEGPREDELGALRSVLDRPARRRGTRGDRGRGVAHALSSCRAAPCAVRRSRVVRRTSRSRPSRARAGTGGAGGVSAARNVASGASASGRSEETRRRPSTTERTTPASRSTRRWRLTAGRDTSGRVRASSPAVRGPRRSARSRSRRTSSATTSNTSTLEA